MHREIVFDTETTGLDAMKGDRLIELGCVEIFNRIPTGRELHFLFNPEGRDVHPEAEAVHGISAASLHDKPRFRDKADEILAFLGDAPLVAHNANFDFGFLNMELKRLGRTIIAPERMVDTLALARRRHPAGPNSLDALCKRYGVDNSQRVKHGALMDSLLLASVYVELLGERQATLGLASVTTEQSRAAAARQGKARQRPVPLAPRIDDATIAAHAAFVDSLGEKAIWWKYMAVAKKA